MDSFKKILWNNKKLFSSHNKWLIQLVNSINFDNKNNKEKIIEINKILKTKIKVCSCWDLMCSRTCQYNLNIHDVVILIILFFLHLKYSLQKQYQNLYI